MMVLIALVLFLLTISSVAMFLASIVNATNSFDLTMSIFSFCFFLLVLGVCFFTPLVFKSKSSFSYRQYRQQLKKQRKKNDF